MTQKERTTSRNAVITNRFDSHKINTLIRQITLGHKSAGDARGALGMTSVYTHTRPETQKRQIERALQLWPESLEVARCWAVRDRTDD
jgi:hypothetical protein